MSLGLAIKCFFQVLRDKGFRETARRALESKGAKAIEASMPPDATLVEMPKLELTGRTSKMDGEAVRLLGLLQRDARLVDFLFEDIASYDDAQVGAAVRDVHRQAASCLKKYVDLAPILDREEGQPVDVPAGFNIEQIQLTGSVRGHGPFRGALQHRGWKVRGVSLPAPVAGVDPLVLAKAEVEIA